MERESGRVHLVTGAASGIGRDVAELLAVRGAALSLADVDAERADCAAEQLRAEYGVPAIALGFDQRARSAADDLVTATVDALGGLDVLINVAGIYPKQLLAATTDAIWDEVIETNLSGVFRCCRAAAPELSARGGAIVNVSSSAVLTPGIGHAAYAASKGGVVALTKALAKELAPNVRVNVVAPGPTATDNVTRQLPSDRPIDESAREIFGDALLLGRWGTPRDIAHAIAFLASDESAFITGQTMHVNGGVVMA